MQPKKDFMLMSPIVFFKTILTIVTMAASLKGTRRQPLVFHRGGINTLEKSWKAQSA